MTREEMLISLSQHSKAARKLYFTLLVREKVKRFAITYERLCRASGLHAETIQNALRRMAALDHIKITKGKCVQTEPGVYQHLPNAYSTTSRARIKESLLGMLAAGEARDAATNVSLDLLDWDVSGAFYEALRALFSQMTIAKLLTKTEFIEYLASIKRAMERESGKRGETGDGQ